MSVSWRIADGLVWLESDEAATFEEWRGALEAALADPEFRAGMGVLHDWRRHRGVMPSAEVLKRSEYLARNAARFQRIRWAVVVASNAGFGLGRMAEVLTEPGAALRVFRDPVEAEAWARGGVKQAGEGS
jgi:hypothetical protein